MKKVLVTGATGFIGRHVLKPLVESHFEVHATTSKSLLSTQSASVPCTWHIVDLLNPTQVKSLLRAVKPTHLLHFAWYNIPGKCLRAEENFLWVQASLELLRQFREQGGERVVMAGSGFEYDWNYGYCSELVTPKKPYYPYGICKHALQEMLITYSEVTQLSSAWGYIFNVYGSHDHPKRLVSSVICSLLRGEPALCSHGNQFRDYLYVQDLADAFVILLKNNVTGLFNVASGEPVRVKEIVYKIAEKLGRTDLIKLGAISTSAGEPPLLVADVTSLSNKLGFFPKYTLDNGLDLTINWWKSQGVYR